MKSTLSVLGCFSVVGMAFLSMNVCAGSMTVSAWTDKTSYDVGELVKIDVIWSVTDPPDFEHDWCVVILDPHKVGLEFAPIYSGEYNATTQGGTGDVDVYCDDLDGTAYYEWDSSEGSAGTWIVDVIVEAWDYPSRMVYDDTTSTNTFTLSD